MTKEKGKMIVYITEDHKIRDSHMCFTMDWNKKLSVWKMVFHIVFNTKRGRKQLIWNIESCMKYALDHSECYRGDGSADVCIATSNKDFHAIWRNK